MKHPRIFLSPPHMGGSEADFVREAFDTNFIAPAGPHITAFEQEMEAYLGIAGRGWCVALSSGTAALHIALRLCGVGPDDLVPCSDLTFIGSAGPIRYLGAEPVFIDAEKTSWNLDPELAVEWLDAQAAQGRTPKALVAVHLFGQPTDLGPLVRACERLGVHLIEDAAESLGALYGGQPTGTFGRFGILSFNGNKIITTSGGGMLVCRSEDDARRARFLATQARDDAPHYEHSTVGYNYRMSNVCAAIGRGQLEVIDRRVEEKRRVFAAYRNRLDRFEREGVIAFQPEAEGTRHNRWLTCLTLGGEQREAYRTRERIRLALETENIESRPVWKPMHAQPVFKQNAFIRRQSESETGPPPGGCAVGTDLFTRGLCLPSGTALTAEQIDRICEVLMIILKSY